MMKELNELYIKVKQEFQLKQDVIFTTLSSFNPITYEKTIIKEKEIHLLGETHYSFAPVAYLHTNITPLLSREPSNWAIFKEEMYKPNAIRKNDIMIPCHYYVNEVSKLLNIPIISALVDIKSDKAISYLEDKLSCNIDLDTILCHEYFNMLPTEYKTAKKNVKLDRIKIISELLDLNNESVMEKLSDKPPVSFKDIILYWNELSRDRFMEILDELDASKILVSVGKLHLPAFK